MSSVSVANIFVRSVMLSIHEQTEKMRNYRGKMLDVHRGGGGEELSVQLLNVWLHRRFELETIKKCLQSYPSKTWKWKISLCSTRSCVMRTLSSLP